MASVIKTLILLKMLVLLGVCSRKTSRLQLGAGKHTEACWEAQCLGSVWDFLFRLDHMNFFSSALDFYPEFAVHPLKFLCFG